MFLLYNFLITITFPLWLPWMLLRSSRRKEKPHWKERMGDYKIQRNKDRKRVWIHAVSVGEVMAALPILSMLRKSKENPEIVLTVTTSSGYRTAVEHAAELYDFVFYFPIDVPRFQLSAMQRVQPEVIGIMETELWMNFLWAAKVFEAKTVLLNGRISDRSFPRSMKIRFFYTALLRSMDLCLMQTGTDVERIKALGASNAEVVGNVKFDEAAASVDDSRLAEWREKLCLEPNQMVIVIGSTRGSEEEDLCIEAISKLGNADVRVLHAPRHLERVEELAGKVRQAFGDVALWSKSEVARYTVVDVYGVLSNLYGLADIAIVGGGFENHGGQNLLQPLAHGKPVIHGPHMQNFREAASGASTAGATIVCSNAAELEFALQTLLQDGEQRSRMGTAAQQFVQSHVGAANRYSKRILELLR